MPIIRSYGGKTPKIAPDAFIADNATLIGDVEIGPGASVWFGAVLRADVGFIRVEEGANVQDLAMAPLVETIAAGVACCAAGLRSGALSLW